MWEEEEGGMCRGGGTEGEREQERAKMALALTVCGGDWKGWERGKKKEKAGGGKRKADKGRGKMKKKVKVTGRE